MFDKNGLDDMIKNANEECEKLSGGDYLLYNIACTIRDNLIDYRVLRFGEDE